MLKFSTCPDRLKNCLLSSLYTHKSQAKHIVRDLFNVCSNHIKFKLSRIRLNPRTHTRKNERTRARAQARTHTCTHVRTHARTHARTHIHLQIIFLTHLWPWNKVKVLKSGLNWSTPSKSIIIHCLKDIALTVSEERQTFLFFSNEKIC